MNALATAFKRTEQGILVVTLALATLLPIIDMVGRPLGGFHLMATSEYVQQLTLWLAFVGGMAATSQAKHLTLSTSEFFGEGIWRRMSRLLSYSVAAAVVGILSYASAQVVAANRLEPKVLPIGIPEWVSEIIMPVAMGVMALQFIWNASDKWWGRAVAAAAVAGAFALGLLSPEHAARLWPLALLVVAAALLGAPVFVAMGGVALVLFFAEGTPVAAVSAEVYRLVDSPTLPAIPLLTAAGYVLAESAAAERLVRFFRAIFGWMPGGIAVMVAAVCALFTTFTGGSGVTIIALGGLVYPILRKDGYSEGFSLGLVTAAGSLGLLFPPSLPVILYAVVAKADIKQLFVAGFVPGLLMVLLVSAYAVAVGVRVQAPRQRFEPREAFRALWGAKWDLGLPALVVVSFVSGYATIVESAALAAAYSIVVELAVFRELKPLRDLPRVLSHAATLVGSVVLLLGTALGVTSWFVDAEVPTRLVEWMTGHVHSPALFLLMLNVVLLVLGSVLEMYSAIVVLAPLVVPLGVQYGVDPIHLGVVFLANLELGFLFPPMGLNLFLSAQRFNRPLPSLYRHAFPFLLIMSAGVLAITYLPAITTGVVGLFAG